jgi:hypothetical protein
MLLRLPAGVKGHDLNSCVRTLDDHAQSGSRYGGMNFKRKVFTELMDAVGRGEISNVDRRPQGSIGEVWVRLVFAFLRDQRV